MATISNLIQKFESIDFRDIVVQSIEDTEQEYADKNAEQMFTGVDNKGEYISPPYARKTVEIKRYKGQPTDRVTLKDTGKHYAGLYVRVTGDNIESGSHDEKSAELQDKYGKDIYGLGGDFKREYVFGPLLLRVKQLVQDRYQIAL